MPVFPRCEPDNGIEVREELILPMRSDLEDYSLENGYMVTKEFLEKQIPVVLKINGT